MRVFVRTVKNNYAQLYASVPDADFGDARHRTFRIQLRVETCALHLTMRRSESHESEVQRSPSLDSAESEFTRAARRGHRLAVGAFYGSRGSNVKDKAARTDGAVVAVPPGVKPQEKRVSAGGKYVVFYLDLSFIFLLEFEKLKMARGCLCCVKYMMFLFNLLFWVSIRALPKLCNIHFGAISSMSKYFSSLMKFLWMVLLQQP